jgi:hypothetical protein
MVCDLRLFMNSGGEDGFDYFKLGGDIYELFPGTWW